MQQNYAQNPKADTRMALDAAEAISKGAETFASFMAYLREQSIANSQAKALLQNAVKEGSLSFTESLYGESLTDFGEMLRKHGVNCVACNVKEGGKDEHVLLYASSQEAMVSHLREVFLASRDKVFQVEKETLARFTKDMELKEKPGISYSEMCYAKDRAAKNHLMFSAQKKKDGTYSIFYRVEDKDKYDVIFAGVEQERKDAGKKVYEQADYDRKSRESVVNQVFGEPKKDYFCGNATGSKSLYVTKEGFYYEEEGKNPIREFVSRKTDDYEQQLCSRIDRIGNPAMISWKRAMELGGNLKNSILMGEKNVTTLDEALKRMGYKSLREVDSKELEARFRKNPEFIRDQEMREAYYRLQRSVDLYRTLQESRADRPYVKDSERQAFEAEHEARMEFETCVNSSRGEYSQAAKEYVGGELGADEIKDFADEHGGEHKTESRMGWSEPYDIPDYLDRNNDDILDREQDDKEIDFGVDAEEMEKGE